MFDLQFIFLITQTNKASSFHNPKNTKANRDYDKFSRRSSIINYLLNFKKMTGL